MSQHDQPDVVLKYRGVYDGNNPLLRAGTARVCRDFRVMPGEYLRLREGRKARFNVAPLQVQQIREYRALNSDGADGHLVQMTDGAASAWYFMTTNPAFPYTPIHMEAISTAVDGGLALMNPVAHTNLSDRPLYYNGLGTFASDGSRPPFSTRFGGASRYFGLDCYSPSGQAPTVAWAAGGGGVNKIQNRVEIWVGVYHEPTGHFSNGMYAGFLATQTGLGKITVSNLDRIKVAYHNGTELGELYYVFYATIDMGIVKGVPYLILDDSLDGPYRVPVTQTSAELSLTADTDNGWILDTTSERPIENFPPRPMRHIAMGNNGRLYGVLQESGHGIASGPQFAYVPTARDTAAVCWSCAPGDRPNQNFVGDPLQCWPLTNIAHAPTAQQPLLVEPLEDEQIMLVLTATATMLLIEQNDGLHTYNVRSRTHGIRNPKSFARTPYGPMWVTQRNQLVRYDVASGQVEVMSGHYHSLLKGKIVTCADYILSPVDQVDRYQVWFSDATTLIHDFAVRTESFPWGQAYTYTGQDVAAARTCVDQFGNQHHIIAKTAFYTVGLQPDTQTVPTTDETYVAQTSTLTVTEPEGYYEGNWDAYGDANWRKSIPEMDVIGDAAPSAQLGGAHPISVEWYKDFAEVINANRNLGAVKLAPQGEPHMIRAVLTKAHAFWYKVAIRLKGHSTDHPSFQTHPLSVDQGNLTKNFYGHVLQTLVQLAKRESNRA